FDGVVLLFEFRLADSLWSHGNVVDTALKLAAGNDHQGPLMAPYQSRDMGVIGHARTQYHGVSLGIIGDEHEGVRDFSLVLEYVDSAGSGDPVRELRLVPTNIQRRHYVIEQVGGDAAGVIPIFPEPEETVGVVLAGRRVAEPHLPVNVVIPLAVGAGVRVNSPI